MHDLTSWSFNDHENGEETAYAEKDWNPARLPHLKKSHVQACLKLSKDSDENWVKVLWSDETKIELFDINSTCHV